MHRWHFLILAILFRFFGFITCMDDFVLNYLVFQSFDGDDGDSRNWLYALTICYFNNISVILWRLALLFVKLDVCTNLRQI